MVPAGGEIAQVEGQQRHNLPEHAEPDTSDQQQKNNSGDYKIIGAQIYAFHGRPLQKRVSSHTVWLLLKPYHVVIKTA